MYNELELMNPTRHYFGNTLADLGHTNKNIVVLEADLGKSTFSSIFAKSHPLRYFQMGIAESNLIGTAAGMALCGKVAFACSFACFITGRFDVIRVSVAYNKANVKLIGTHAGIASGEDGYSQQGLEDIGLMNGLPGMIVCQPADGIETEMMIKSIVDIKGPTYIRLTRNKVFKVHEDNYKFIFGKADLIYNSGDDVLIVSSGNVVGHSLHAAKILDTYNIKSTVLNIHTIKPFDNKGFLKYAHKCKSIVTVEDHSIINGLGSIVSKLLSNHLPKHLLCIGINDCFGESGSYKNLYEKYGLNSDGIVSKIKRFIKK